MRTTTMISFCLLCCLVMVTSAAALCDLSLQSPRPIVVKRFGSKTAIVKRSLTSLRLTLNESITFHCPTGLTISDSNNGYGYGSANGKVRVNSPTTELRCTDSGVYLDQRVVVQSAHSATIVCNAAIGQTLYESNSSLVGCDTDDAMTLLIGYQIQGLADVKLLGMCYDLATTRLNFVSFLAYTSPNLLVETRADTELDALQLDINIGSVSKYFRFASDAEYRELIANQKHLGEHFQSTLFDFANLLQDKQQVEQYGENYKDMLNIVWLHALRLGNWQRWLEALRTISDRNGDQFDIRIGVSGVVNLPQQCNNGSQVPLQLKGTDDLVLSVPEHIWAHVRSLQPTGGTADEFVLVGQNSPYVSNVFQLDLSRSLINLSLSLSRGRSMFPN